MIVLSSGLVLTTTPALSPDNPLIGWKNLVTRSNVSADGENAAHPASNLANPSTFLRWQGIAAAAQYVTAVIDSADDVDYVGIAGHNFGSEQIPIAIEGHTGVDAYTKVLLHFDGSDGATTFEDSSPAPKAFTPAGHVQLDTADSKFGGAAGLFDGNGDYITTPDHADFDLGSGDWTIETWFKCTAAVGSNRVICGTVGPLWDVTDTAFALYLNTAGLLTGEAVIGGNWRTVQGAAVFSDVSNPGWHHAAFVRDGGSLRLYVDGVQIDSEACSGAMTNSPSQLAIGNWGDAIEATESWKGWLDEFRMSKGICRYPGGTTFTPAARAFPWVEIVQETLLGDDTPALFRFTPQPLAAVRMRLGAGLAIPRAAVFYAGKLTVLQRRIYVGHTPLPYGRATNITNGRSESGNFMGRIVTGSRTQTSVHLANLTPAWYRTELEPFLQAAQEAPFFFAWRPSSYPREVGYAWLTNDPQPSNQRSNGMMQVELQMAGIVR
jgi:hypothetical protein